MRSSLKFLGMMLIAGCGMSACVWADETAPADSSSVYVQQMPSIGDRDFSAVPAGGISTPVSLTQRNLPQDLPVEAVPTPTALTSGLMVLALLAAVRIVRHLKRA